MEDVSYSLDNEQQFWDALLHIVSAPCQSDDRIDNALRAYLGLTTKYKDLYLSTEYDVARCSYQLLSSSLFAAHAEYVRRQIIYSLLQEDDLDTLHVIASFLLFDGRQHEEAFHQMNGDGAFARLLELIQAQRHGGDAVVPGLHRLLMDLLYEMSRIQRIKIADLVLVDDDFVRCLFETIEDACSDADDPYHYSVIRVILVLNEQFMISAHDPAEDAYTLTNKVVKVLAMFGNAYKTFGENIILLINREGETSLQLLILKLLYLMFTTPGTYEYFYTNDLRVLVDILIRNLLDLPEEALALRHTYLRVLYPLLAHTQLKYPPHYKRDELRNLLRALVRGQFSSASDVGCSPILHFEDADDTTKRLVARCASVSWLQYTSSDLAIDQRPTTTVLSSPSSPSPSLPLPPPPPPPPSSSSPPPSTSTSASTSASISTADVVPLPHISDAEIGEPLELSRTISCTVAPPVAPASDDGSASASPVAATAAESQFRRRLPSLLGRLHSEVSCAAVGHDTLPNCASSPSSPAPAPAALLASANICPPKTPAPKPKVKPDPPKARRLTGRRVVDDDGSPAAAADEAQPRGRSTAERVEIVVEDAIDDSPSPTTTTAAAAAAAAADDKHTDIAAAAAAAAALPARRVSSSTSSLPTLLLPLSPPLRSAASAPSPSAPRSPSPSPSPPPPLLPPQPRRPASSLNSSHIPPAVPPPRRSSSHSAQTHAHAHTSTLSSPQSKHALQQTKPEPPRARRSGKGAAAAAAATAAATAAAAAATHRTASPIINSSAHLHHVGHGHAEPAPALAHAETE